MSRPGKREDLFIPFLQVAADWFAILAAFLAAYAARFRPPVSNWVPVTKGQPGLAMYIWGGMIAAVIWMIIFKSLRMYGRRRNAGPLDELFLTFKGATLGMLVVTALTFFYRGFSFSRMVFILIYGFSVLFIWIARIAISALERNLHRKGKGLIRVLLVGSGKWAGIMLDKIRKNPDYGMEIAGTLDCGVKGGPGLNLTASVFPAACRGVSERIQKSSSMQIEDSPPLAAGSFKCLGPLSGVAEIVSAHRIDLILTAFEGDQNPYLTDIMNACVGLNVEFGSIPDSLEMMTSRLRVEEIGGVPVLKIKDVPITGWKAVFKRAMDVSVSLAALIILSPVFLLAAAAVRLGSKGPVFYRQGRVGLDGREFDLIKFRTMRIDAEKSTGPVWTVKNDARVTRAGRWLRRTSLDELPQLWNVLRGEMSLVGPRPERRHFVDRFRSQVPRYLDRHRVKSGMTGWAQVNGLRGNVSIEERTRYDIYYVENWSLYLDVKIILMTLGAVVSGKNSY
ncbi:undecaprenyl-phosphate glucose phosphotransferase [bacterium]|nr:undecaprenyl-phosphate glucose phosphotransferase [bacterium]